MTRKDFNWFANWLGQHHSEISQEALSELCSYFKKANPRFDKWRFMEAVELAAQAHEDDRGGWTP